MPLSDSKKSAKNGGLEATRINFFLLIIRSRNRKLKVGVNFFFFCEFYEVEGEGWGRAEGGLNRSTFKCAKFLVTA